MKSYNVIQRMLYKCYTKKLHAETHVTKVSKLCSAVRRILLLCEHRWLVIKRDY